MRIVDGHIEYNEMERRRIVAAQLRPIIEREVEEAHRREIARLGTRWGRRMARMAKRLDELERAIATRRN